MKCPLGTFFDSSTKRCHPCPLGEYEDTNGSLKCTRCPEYTFTKKMHTKSLQDCIRRYLSQYSYNLNRIYTNISSFTAGLCRPGYYSRRKRYHGTRLALEPCLMCAVGFYQPEYGQNHCLPCPYNTTTKYRGSMDINNCLPLYKIEDDICQTESCLNGGQCVQEEDSFSCECPDYYVGEWKPSFISIQLCRRN